MSKQTINIGASPNDGTGTPLRTSFDYTNQNFTELYTALGGGVGLPGATTQVIFNDGGTNLAGDAGLVYNKTTDALTVAGLVTAGSATITGAATVGTTLGVTGASTLASASVTGSFGAAGLNVTGATIPANGAYLATTNTLGFSANSLLQMSLTTSGSLMINTATITDAAHLTVACTTGSGAKTPLSLKVGVDAAGFVAVTLRNQTASQGTIVVDVTGVRYLTASDYRLKNVVGHISDGLDRVNALKPSVYKWKADGSNGEGFIAHELAEVVPAAVNGLKDDMNEDGTIKPQNVDMSRIVPILVAAIQELTARVQTLEAR